MTVIAGRKNQVEFLIAARFCFPINRMAPRAGKWATISRVGWRQNPKSNQGGNYMVQIIETVSGLAMFLIQASIPALCSAAAYVAATM